MVLFSFASTDCCIIDSATFMDEFVFVSEFAEVVKGNFAVVSITVTEFHKHVAGFAV